MNREDEWERDFTDFMGYMATHPEEFPEEHQVMNDFFRGGPRPKRRSFSEWLIDQDPIDGSRDVVGDQRCYFASFHYFKKDRNELTHWIRFVLWSIIGVLLMPFIVNYFFRSKTDRYKEIPMWDGPAKYVLLTILIFCLVLLSILCFKKLRIKRECWWKYGFEAPPRDMQKKILEYRDKQLPEDEARRIGQLLFIYPSIWSPRQTGTNFYKRK